MKEAHRSEGRSDGRRHDAAPAETGAAMTRGQFLHRMPWLAAAGGLLLTTAALFRSLIPSHITGPSRTLRIGRPGDYAPGMIKLFKEAGVIVFCDRRGLHALSLTCTHLGCAVHFDRRGFHCPCHGSRYALDGQVLKGPAPRSLPWFEIALLPNGDLAVDRARRVSPGTKFALSSARAAAAPGLSVVHHG